MSKIKTAFFCSNCGYESAKWLGKCPGCAQWNTFTEEVLQKDSQQEIKWDGYQNKKKGSGVIALEAVKAGEEKRLVTKDPELNRCTWRRYCAGQPGVGSRRTRYW